MNHAKLIASLAIPFAFAACQLKTPEELFDKVPLALTQYSISGVSGTIGDKAVEVDLRWTGISYRNSVATFATSQSGARVTVNGAVQYSGVTTNDFAQPVVYLVKGFNDETRSYTVSVKAGFPVPDTGQVLCSSGAGANAALAACPNASVGAVQDGDFVDIPAKRSFTGPVQHSIYSNDYTTTDNVTGLIWRSCSEGLTGQACDQGAAATIPWATAKDNTCTALNTANDGSGYAGLKTWRLPSSYELRTILNYTGATPTVDAAYFPQTVASNYWTGTTVIGTPTTAWFVSFSSGTINNNLKTTSYSVRCVAGAQSAFLQTYVENGDGTITDKETSLVWQKCSYGQANDSNCTGSTTLITWLGGLSYCNTLSLAGKSWRLPNANELNTLVVQKASTPSIDATYFPNTFTLTYWTSTTAISVASAIDVNFGNGNSASNTKSSTERVRCVSGP